MAKKQKERSKSRSESESRAVRKRKRRLHYSLLGGLIIIMGISAFYFVAMDVFPGLTLWQMYQNVASPYVRYVNITEGMRKEEVASRFAKTLGWTEAQKNQ